MFYWPHMARKIIVYLKGSLVSGPIAVVSSEGKFMSGKVSCYKERVDMWAICWLQLPAAGVI